jgi:hypothetical protein
MDGESGVGGGAAHEEAVPAGLLAVLFRRVLRLQGADELTVHCAWCDRIKRGEEWVVEEVRSVWPGKRRQRPATHGICPDCLERLTAVRRE